MTDPSSDLPSAATRPADIVLAPSSDLLVTWNDGHASVFEPEYLRRQCPCATCRTEREKPKPLEKPGGLRMYPGKWVRELEVLKLEYVGNYALSIVWNDGHQTGIYAFRYLREICPCETCSPTGPRPS